MLPLAGVVMMTQERYNIIMQLWFNGLYIVLFIKQNKEQDMINYLQYEFNHPSQHHQQSLLLEPLNESIQPNPNIHNHYNDHYHTLTPLPSKPSEMLDYTLLNQSQQHIQQNPLFEHESQRQRPWEDEQSSKNRTKEQRRLKNETKNIPKNFGKGIISFMEKNEAKIRTLLQEHSLSYSSFKSLMKGEKKVINTIADLRRLWTHEVYGKCMRIISNLFFRRYSLEYIFNSRITNYSSHIKYRTSLWQAIKHPQQFNHIKEY